MTQQPQSVAVSALHIAYEAKGDADGDLIKPYKEAPEQVAELILE